MARELDYENLSEDDLAYIKDRPWLVDEALQEGYEIDLSSGKTKDLAKSEPEGEGEGDPGEEEVESENPYADWTNSQMRKELEGRGLSTEGNKAELVQRLEEDDATE